MRRASRASAVRFALRSMADGVGIGGSVSTRPANSRQMPHRIKKNQRQIPNHHVNLVSAWISFAESVQTVMVYCFGELPIPPFYSEGLHPMLRFNEAKAAQAAARFLMHRGQPMSYLKLVKLLYFADREALLRWGRPITTDCYVSMDKGPVVSRIYELIADGPPPDIRSPWTDLISPPENYEVTLRQSPPPDDELSRAEEALIDEIFAEHGAKSRWELVDLSHAFPEWRNPDGSALPIRIEDILASGGTPEPEIRSILAELDGLRAVQS
jgi:uncharacterized phage-associated protein